MIHVLCFLWLSFALGQDDGANRVIAATKDWSITAQQFQRYLDLLPDQQHQYFDAHPREFLDQLVRIWVMAAEAKTQGLDKTPQFKAIVDFYSNNMLAGELHRQQVTGAVTADDDAVKAFYEGHKAQFMTVKLLQIFVPRNDGRKRIEEAMAKLQNGASFESVAKEYSKDVDLGYITKGQLPASLDAAAFSLKEGAYSDILESPLGFHLLRVSEIKVASLSEVAAQIRQRLDTDEFDARIDAKIKDAGVTIDASFFTK